ncbi:hypothetical protein EAF00_002748 [Botryotinia globosa]|nr:hypothetical protein EAF00_002748 [Botryotinia globosa]
MPSMTNERQETAQRNNKHNKYKLQPESPESDLLVEIDSRLELRHSRLKMYRVFAGSNKHRCPSVLGSTFMPFVRVSSYLFLLVPAAEKR